MKSRMAWFAVAILFLLAMNVSAGMCAEASTGSPNSIGASHGASTQTLSLGVVGGVLSPGVQTYSLRGGRLVAAWILGTPIDLRSSTLYYDFNVVVSGLSATGTASFDLVTQTSHWSHTEVKGTVIINAMTPAVFFPLGCTAGLNCTSEIPALFNGTGTVTFSSGSSVTTASLSMGFESAYLNPFGGPVSFASNSGEVIVIADYSQARVQWTDVQMGGNAVGTFGGSSVSGNFGMLVNSSEDLRSGIEVDEGAISFFGMSNPALNGLGVFIGYSTIPTGSSVACPGFPQGTCTMTGLESSGVFAMTTSGGMLAGKYATAWATPAVVFSSSISASLGSPRGHA
jgi:hypothetical protein